MSDLAPLVEQLAREHLGRRERRAFARCLGQFPLQLGPTEYPLLLTDGYLDELPVLFVVLDTRVVAFSIDDCAAVAEVELTNLNEVAVDGSDDSAGLVLRSRTAPELRVSAVGDEAWATELRDCIAACAPALNEPQDEGFREAEPAGARCPGCETRFEPSYGSTQCSVCGFLVFTDDGEPFIPFEPNTDSPNEDDEGPDDERLKPFDTENPFLREVFRDPAFGRVPNGSEALLRSVSPDPDEKLVAAIRLRHGLSGWGTLMLTTSWLRWIKIVPFRHDDYWPYDFAIEADGGPFQTTILRTVSGEQFQTRWSKARDFQRLHRLLQQAMLWEPPRLNSSESIRRMSIADELDRLVRLFQEGMLTEHEFALAKQRLLETDLD